VGRSSERAGPAAARGSAPAAPAAPSPPGPPVTPGAPPAQGAQDAWAVPGVHAEPSTAASAGEAGHASREAVARQICLRMLTAAPRTRAELAAALRRRGVPEDTAEAVLGRFSDVKLIDDAAFAAAWVETRHHGRGLARRALEAELRQRGVPQEDIKTAVSGLDPRQEIATARGLVERRLASTRGQPLTARIRRLTGLLARKGYSPAIAYRVVREALEQEGLDPAAAGIDLDDPPDAESDGQSAAW
jgi:regulatory protein